MTRPMIGMTTYREPASWGTWRQVPATLLAICVTTPLNFLLL